MFGPLFELHDIVPFPNGILRPLEFLEELQGFRGFGRELCQIAGFLGFNAIGVQHLLAQWSCTGVGQTPVRKLQWIDSVEFDLALHATQAPAEFSRGCGIHYLRELPLAARLFCSKPREQLSPVSLAI